MNGYDPLKKWRVVPVVQILLKLRKHTFSNQIEDLNLRAKRCLKTDFVFNIPHGTRPTDFGVK